MAGFHEDNFITLDPHYVQPESEGQKLYFQGVPRGVHYSKVGPVLDFCFLFKTAQEHRQWFEDMAERIYRHSSDAVFECD